MSFGSSHRRGSFSAYGLLLAVLALVSQLALGAMVLPDDAAASEAATLEAMSVMCASGSAPTVVDTGATPRRLPVRHRHHDGPLCPLSLALALPAVVLTATAVLAPPVAGPVLRLASARGARAPPSRVCTTGLPRGPPSLA